MAKTKKAPTFGEVVNETARASVGETTAGHQQSENNKRMNSWMRSERDRGSSTGSRSARARESLRNRG